MSDDLDDFTAQLNNAGGDGDKPAGETASGPKLPPGMTPEQIAAIKEAQEMKKKLDEMPLKHEPLKGKVDIQWFGHAGFKIQFKDKDDTQRCIYIDIWIDNKDCPEEVKQECPNDCDLALVTHG